MNFIIILLLLIYLTKLDSFKIDKLPITVNQKFKSFSPIYVTRNFNLKDQPQLILMIKLKNLKPLLLNLLYAFSSSIYIVYILTFDVIYKLFDLIKPNSMSFFKDKLVWVTGASSGIGKALAIHLAKLNSQLILSSRSKIDLEKVSQECYAINPDCKILIFPIDLSNEYHNIDNFYNELKLQMSMKKMNESIDVLINNAGISVRGSSLATNMQTTESIMVEI